VVTEYYRRVAGHVHAAENRDPGPDRDTEWHEARKAAKRVRYAAEAAAPILGKPARRLIKQVKHIQELLGDHQDAVVARPVLRELAVTAQLDNENGFTYGLLHQQQTDSAQLSEHDITAAWRQLRRTAGAVTD
jgi:CHAD domain-containing protein